MAVIGKNILENLTTGMYSDSKVIYREYIQNACDQIDVAERIGLIEKGQGQVDIEIDTKKRQIEIRDNATGIEKKNFQSKLGDIANSDKTRGEDKGFRGIGRLCGLAYCKTLTFISSYAGENVESHMIIDAKKMRDLLNSPEKYSIDDILSQIISFNEYPAEEKMHYFIVRMTDINRENTDLLDDKKIKEYLSFVAPVPFPSKFLLKGKIYDHALKLGYHIDEYRIYVQGGQLFKEYGTSLYRKSKDSNGSKVKYDQLVEVAFDDIYNSKKELIAWMWYGLCKFEGAIPKAENPMYGFRLRQSNIQIGDNAVIADFFKEDRGNSYFVGEIYAVHKELTPNSQRNYFSENETRVVFEDELRKYCYYTLHKVYNDASVYRKNYKKLEDYATAVAELNSKTKTGFIDAAEKASLENKVATSEKQKDDAQRVIDKINSRSVSPESPEVVVRNAIKSGFEKKDIERKAKEAEKQQKELEKGQSTEHYFTDSLSKLDKKERKLIAKMLGIVSKHVDAIALSNIKSAVEKEFK